MNYSKKILRKLSVILLVIIMIFMSAQQFKSIEQVAVMKKQENVRLQDDFYEAINKEWLDQAKIRSGHSSESTLSNISDRVAGDLNVIFSTLLEHEQDYDTKSVEKKMITLYNNILNREERNKQGIQPIQNYLNQIKDISTMKDLTEVLRDKKISALNRLIGFEVTTDAKNSKAHVLEISSSVLSLGDADEYTRPSRESESKKEATIAYYKKLLMLSGYEEETARKKIENILQFEKKLAPFLIGSNEASTHENLYEAIYNVYTIKELEEIATNLEFGTLMKARGYDKANKIILQEPKWLEQLNALYKLENLEMIKDYLEIGILDMSSSYLSEAFREAAKDYKKEIYGIVGDIPEEEVAFNLVNSAFSSELGKLYVKEHFTKEAQKDVEVLAEKIIEKYKIRINELDWMSEVTKIRAIEKLDAITIKIGYPKEWENYKGLEIKAYEEGGTLIENMISMSDFEHKKELSQMNKAVDKLEFAMPTQTVNACYVPTNNDITFPAGILQIPLYDITQSKEVNLGAIGAVIGHEVSHAFDNNGARFDKAGNLANWWTEEDYTKFEERTKKVRDFYSQIELLPGEKVNGDLTVGENIADIGAIACMLDILSDMPSADYKAFFESWGATWRIVATPEYQIQALKTDVHSPHKIRVNAVLQQFEEFYQTYDITKGDGMYIRPEDRLRIW
ncbi:MAG: M13 family metallopeptidase [Cellulosilyticaceae bacterium]